MTGRALPPTSAFAGDDGSPDPALVAAVEAVRAGRGTVADVVEALRTARVLVPVVARLEQSGTGADGLHVDKEASAGVVALRAPDGRTALPVFSGAAALAAWSGDARPVPAEGPRAAASALQEGWELLVLDPAGPGTLVVPRPAVVALATATPWRPAVVDGEVSGDVRDAVTLAVGEVDGVVSADAVPGRRAEVAVVVRLPGGLDRGALDAVLRRVSAVIAADATFASRVDSVELRVVG
ncbi:SseB family protein [Actinotalea sp. AC32]|nr:SseB family protein [Actinotalea sp. AC32]